MDLQSMEMHKKSALLSARHSTAITSKYPQQVLVLRPTQPIYTWRFNSRAKVDRLISHRETRGFAAYGAAVQSNNPTAQLLIKLNQLEVEHQAHWTQLVRDSSHIPKTFKGYVGQLTQDERRAIRTNTPYPPALQRKLLILARNVAFDLFRIVGKPERHRPNQKVYLKDTLIFRYALCIMIHYTHWLALGQDITKSHEKIANDVVDLHVAAMGTFFNGVLTNDKNLIMIHRSIRHLLRVGGAYVG